MRLQIRRVRFNDVRNALLPLKMVRYDLRNRVPYNTFCNVEL
jgi:hypothetical protein